MGNRKRLQRTSLRARGLWLSYFDILAACQLTNWSSIALLPPPSMSMNIPEPGAAHTGSSGTGLILVLIITFILADFFPQLDPSREREGDPLMQPVFVYAKEQYQKSLVCHIYIYIYS
ncbi:uncharacterized protein LY79DRAFT_252931 [Colletotrichum navitas]|uniref:Uncharacterized protein n=1 Tax=Colletotrichum navitas TaxID=681940 RepID=A0AAD8V8Y5_9PEZI|nr:uncharacterized protein LY79DRAFT_252931 [Colletotrichum navitas]KAK1598712.1 hypothetical protein LY79DRAFT_252931 [Colletotrichum navitas]